MVHDLSDQCSTLYLIFGKEKTFIDTNPFPSPLTGEGLPCGVMQHTPQGEFSPARGRETLRREGKHSLTSERGCV
jgi:hypothetical protein